MNPSKGSNTNKGRNNENGLNHIEEEEGKKKAFMFQYSSESGFEDRLLLRLFSSFVLPFLNIDMSHASKLGSFKFFFFQRQEK
ncbi:hypothetical protein OUZ56_004698 [Daphnia magna]|uniref:Uncharacterized protein n=1 Tax=Daphnia magna TaxID=35525 RepID=A0ABQ9YQS0_9CRUS|nr:hypothetical protein OUZ56_004698 [Daphnia magna]